MESRLQPSMAEDGKKRNEELVRRYFEEIVDGRSLAGLEEIFHPDCRIMRADRSQPLVGHAALRRFLRMSIAAVPSVATTLHAIAGVDDCVIAHVSHQAKFGRFVITPVGLCFANGRSATWQAMARFQIREGRIIEEHVIRDEMTILRQLGMLKRRHWASVSLRNAGRAITNMFIHKNKSAGSR